MLSIIEKNIEHNNIPINKGVDFKLIEGGKYKINIGVDKNKTKYNKDGSIDRRHCNKMSGVSSEVYGFTLEEVKKMIALFDKRINEAPDENKKKIAHRNKMLFVIGINIGLRISDIVTLKWSFFFKKDMTFNDFYKIQPKKTRKTGKYVTLYFNKALKKAIIEYAENYPITDINDFIFKSRKGDKHITERSVWKIIVDAASECDIKKNVGTHSLRKTFGYHVWHNAKDKEKALVMLMAIFNHSSVAITKKYIGVMSEEIEEIFNDLNLGIECL